MRLRARAPGKVNLCLFLGPLREDGRHELVTLFESVSVADTLTLTTTDEAHDEVVCPRVEEPNLVSRAVEGLRARGWDGPRVRIEIEKRIPIAAGMGGGSADAACALRLAMELAPGRPEEVAALAAALGADVPSQLVPGVVLGTGAGDVVESYEALAPHGLVIVPHDAPLATPDVYRESDRLGLPRDGDELARRYDALAHSLRPGVRLSDDLLVNDLEPAALSLCPEIDGLLAAVRGAGADRALVCGSGPTVAGIFWEADGLERANAAARLLAERFPDATSATPVGVEFGMPLFA